MPRPESAVDAWYAELLRAGESVPRVGEFLASHDLDEVGMIALLRRPVPVRLLEIVASRPPWSRRPRVLGAVVLNPRVPRSLALRLLPELFWRDLAEVAAALRIPAPVRARAEALIQDMLPDLRLGDRISLARLATPGVLRPVLGDAEARVVRAALDNPRLREDELLLALRRSAVPIVLLRETAASRRWTDRYAVRLALVLQKRTPLALALAQLSSLLPRDLERISRTAELAPLVQAAAARVAGGRP